MLDARQQAAQVELSGLDFLVRRLRRDVDEGPVARALELANVPAEADQVRTDVRRVLLERDEYARLALGNSLDQELRGEDRLAAARRARYQRGAAQRQATARNRVESRDSGRRLLDRRRCQRLRHHTSGWPGRGSDCRSSPSRTFSESVRSPTMRRIG